MAANGLHRNRERLRELNHGWTRGSPSHDRPDQGRGCLRVCGSSGAQLLQERLRKLWPHACRLVLEVDKRLLHLGLALPDLQRPTFEVTRLVILPPQTQVEEVSRYLKWSGEVLGFGNAQRSAVLLQRGE